MKRAIVTGAASGLGLEICNQLAALPNFVITGIDHKYGHDVRLLETLPRLAQVDCLINCAGINRIAWLESVRDEDWDETIAVNAKALWAVTRHYLPQLAASRGTVLNIVSSASHTPMRASIAYNASKAAAHMITLQMARELYDRHGITAFGISPNKLKGTAMSESIDEQVCATRGWTPEHAREYQLAGLAIGEEIEPSTLAEFIAFLLEDKQRHKHFHGCIIPYGA
jgi:NAD(P)-dependent dehydrogenase (short-subunit alcohol dehydrogenase family)